MTDLSWSAAQALVWRYGWNAVSYQILNPGMQRWFSRSGDAVAGYACYGGMRIIAGAPVCRQERLNDVAAELEADANACGERVLFFGAGARLKQVYARRSDHCLMRLGAQPVWDPCHWPTIVRQKASLRAQLHRARNKGVRIREWPITRSRDANALRAVLRQWLASRGMPPLEFMATPDLLSRLEDRRVFVAERGHHCDVVGFLVATPIPARSGWLVEQWPRTRSAPNGTTHLLVHAAMRAFAADGSRYATLGLAPLSHRGGGEAGETHSTQAVWLRLGLRWLRSHGCRFYNFEGLETFKASLQPMAWEPVLAVAQGERITPRMLWAVAGVFSQGSPGQFVARALASATVQELRSLRPSHRRFLSRIVSTASKS